MGRKKRNKTSKHRLVQESHHERLKAGDELAQAGLQTTLVSFHFLQGSVFQDLEKARNTVKNSNIPSPDSLFFFKAVGSREDAGRLELCLRLRHPTFHLTLEAHRAYSRSPLLSQGRHTKLKRTHFFLVNSTPFLSF